MYKNKSLSALINKFLNCENSDFTEYCKGYITDNANINALGDGVYYYNGWGSSTMTGTPPFSNDYGIWIRRTPYDSVGSTGTDIVIRNNGAIYSRKLISEGTWGPWILSDLAGKLDVEQGTARSGSDGIVKVRFKKKFSYNPSVVATSVGGSSSIIAIPKIYNITTTGFEAICIAFSGGSISANADADIQWIAAGE